MFCNKGTADGKKTLEIRQPATKNYTKQGIHVQLQNIKLNDSKLKKQLDIELSQTKLKLHLKSFFGFITVWISSFYSENYIGYMGCIQLISVN